MAGLIGRLGAERVQEGVYRAERGGVEVLLLLTEPLIASFEPTAVEQLERALALPGLERAVVTPDAHTGYGVPIGFTAVSRTHLYPDTVGPDPACSVSLSRMRAPRLAELDKRARRAILVDLEARIAVATRRRRGPRRTRPALPFAELCAILRGERRAARTWVAGTPRLEDRFDAREVAELEGFLRSYVTQAMLSQIGTIGGGNHFLEVQEGLRGDTCVMAHFGSRGLGGKGSELLFERFRRGGALAGADGAPGATDAGGGGEVPPLLVLRCDEPLGRLYDQFQHAMLEYASYHHAAVQAAACEVLAEHLELEAAPELVGHIPHNVIEWRGGAYWQRKGATPAYPDVDLPLLIPGSMSTASYVLEPGPNALRFGASVPHGAGRHLSRSEARRALDQDAADRDFDARGVMGNFRHVPLDESSAAYKDVDEVVRAVEVSGVARVVDRLRPRLVLKGA